MARKSACTTSINKLLSRKSGSYILETTIALPIFIIAIMMLSQIILMFACIEDVCFNFGNQMRQSAIEARFVDQRLLLPSRVLALENSHSQIDSMRLTRLDYRTSTLGMDEIIGLRFRMELDSPNPLGLKTNATANLSLATRAYVGAVRQASPMSEAQFMSDGDPVYIFPNSGEKYHNKSCQVLRAGSMATILSHDLLAKYKSCPKCHSKSAAIGSMVYVFPIDGRDYHLAGCDTLLRNYLEIERSVAIERGYTPCSKCGG